MAVIGSGFQARTQLEAVCAVRDIKRGAGVQSAPGTPRGLRQAQQRTAGRGRTSAVESAQECVEGADIVIAITSAREPVVLGDWLAEGAHINAAGGNHWQRREIDEAAVLRSELIVVDDLEQAKDRVRRPDVAGGPGFSFRWGMAHELSGTWCLAASPGRVSQEGVSPCSSPWAWRWRTSPLRNWYTARPGSRISARSCPSSPSGQERYRRNGQRGGFDHPPLSFR